MPFDLRISFTGLCLFVPSPDEKDLFVTLPAAQRMNGKTKPGSAMPTHRASVFFSSAYQTGVSVPSTSFREILLAGAIELPGSKVRSKADSVVNAQTLKLANILDVAEAAYPPGTETIGENKNVNPAALKPGTDGVGAVIVIRGGRLLSYSASYPWFLPKRPDPRVLAWKVDWLVERIEADNLPSSWLGDTAAKSEVLTPVNGVIELRVKNVPLAESMPEDVPYNPASGGRRANHAKAFYHLLNGQPDTAETPTFGAPRAARSELGGLITCTPGMGTLGTLAATPQAGGPKRVRRSR